MKGLYSSAIEQRKEARGLADGIRNHMRRVAGAEEWRRAAHEETRAAAKRMPSFARRRLQLQQGDFDADNYGYAKILAANILTELTGFSLKGYPVTRLRLTAGELAALRKFKMGPRTIYRIDEAGRELVFEVEAELVDELPAGEGRYWVDDDLLPDNPPREL